MASSRGNSSVTLGLEGVTYDLDFEFGGIFWDGFAPGPRLGSSIAHPQEFQSLAKLCRVHLSSTINYSSRRFLGFTAIPLRGRPKYFSWRESFSEEMAFAGSFRHAVVASRP